MTVPEFSEPGKANWENLNSFHIRIETVVVRLSWDKDSWCSVEATEGDAASRAILSMDVAEYLRNEDPAANVRTFHYRWRVVRRVAKRFAGTVVEQERVVAALRQGWIRLLKLNLVPDVGSMDYFSPAGLRIHIATMASTKRTFYDGFVFFKLDDPKYLIATKNSPEYKLSKIPWDQIVEIGLFYTNPPTDFAVDAQKARRS
jgi:hypothetical protein